MNGRTLSALALPPQANRSVTQSDVDAAPLPANYLAAVAAMAALDRETRRMCKQPLPTDPVEIEAEREMWLALIASCEDELQRLAYHIQARAIRNGGALLREYDL